MKNDMEAYLRERRPQALVLGVDRRRLERGLLALDSLLLTGLLLGLDRGTNVADDVASALAQSSTRNTSPTLHLR